MKMKIKCESMLNKDGCGYMFSTPVLDIWYSEGTWCVSARVAFWSVQLWMGNISDLN